MDSIELSKFPSSGPPSNGATRDDKKWEVMEDYIEETVKIEIYYKEIIGEFACSNWILRHFEKVPSVRATLIDALHKFVADIKSQPKFMQHEPQIFEIHHVCLPKKNQGSESVTLEDFEEFTKRSYDFDTLITYTAFAIITSREISNAGVQQLSKLFEKSVVFQKAKDPYPLRVLYVNDGTEEYYGSEWLTSKIKRDEENPEKSKRKKAKYSDDEEDEDEESEESDDSDDDDEPKRRKQRMEKKQLLKLIKFLSANLHT